MRNRRTVILASAALITLLAAGVTTYYFVTRPRYYDPEVLEPEVFESIEYDTDLLVGTWRCGTMFYRFDEDYSGVTWDEADDVTEEDAQGFTWELYHSRFTHIHNMRMGSVVPKVYYIDTLNLAKLVLKDEFRVVRTFEKME